MLKIASVILFCWIFFRVLKLVFKAAWGVTKIIASILFGIAVPMLIGCLIFAGGLVLLVPVALLGIAFGLLKACV